jgi:hypothetical protein
VAWIPHPARELRQRLVARPAGRDHHPLLVEPGRAGRHPGRGFAADVGVVGAAGGEAEQAAVAEDRRDQGDVGQMGAAAEGVVEDPGLAGALLLAQHRANRLRHRAEVDRDVFRLHHQLAGVVEEGRRAVATLLDVRRVRRAHQDRAHLLAGGAQPAGEDLERDRVEALHRAHLSRVASIVPRSST